MSMNTNTDEIGMMHYENLPMQYTEIFYGCKLEMKISAE